MKPRRKPLRGARKIRFSDIPWKAIITVSIIAALGLTLIVQYVLVKYNENRYRKTFIENLQLNKSVATLTDNLSNERDEFETFITEQLEKNVKLEQDLTQTEICLTETQEENTALLDNLAAVQLQNDTLRRKLETMLGNSSRNGEELSPSPMGPSGLTLKDLRKMTARTAMSGIGLEEVFLEIEEQYNVNALFALAVAKLETGSGTSALFKNNNNLFGMRGSGGWFKYKTKQDSIRAFGKLMANNYFSKGYTTLEKIGPRYAEGSNVWALKAKYHMITDMRKIH